MEKLAEAHIRPTLNRDRHSLHRHLRRLSPDSTKAENTFTAKKRETRQFCCAGDRCNPALAWSGEGIAIRRLAY
jgi:hypothetical protein